MPIVVDIDVMLARRKMAVGALAERVGITPANLAVLKNGRAKAVRFTTLEALCEVLECQPGDLLRWEPDDQPEVLSGSPARSLRQVELVVMPETVRPTFFWYARTALLVAPLNTPETDSLRLAVGGVQRALDPTYVGAGGAELEDHAAAGDGQAHPVPPGPDVAGR